ncbi:MAG: NUDIX domain-containing protein [Patescibacteria group bacterium]
MSDKGFAVFGIIEGLPDGKIPLIHDKDKPAPAMWKLPGGRTENGECPEFALIRELDEEIKINVLPPKDEDVIFEKDLGSHIFRVYKVRYYNGKIAAGDEVEWMKMFSMAEVKQMISENKILPKHAQALSKCLEKL